MAAVRERPPAVAGAFYPADARELALELERCFVDPRGPGQLPERHRRPDRRIVAAIVPHAGYRYSGAIAAHVYGRIAVERPPRSVLLLGVDHGGTSRGAALSARPWRTPLGAVPIDLSLADRLARAPVDVDEAAHAREHSIEVQLPFLQYVLPAPAFVPLQIRYGPYSFLESVAGAVRSAIDGQDTLVLASTDFSHYVPPEEADRLDHRALEAIVARDPRRLVDVVEHDAISMCGIAPTTVLLAALKGRSLRATLLRWGHSGEVEPSGEVVGYAAVVFEDDGAAPVK